MHEKKIRNWNSLESLNLTDEKETKLTVSAKLWHDLVKLQSKLGFYVLPLPIAQV